MAKSFRFTGKTKGYIGVKVQFPVTWRVITGDWRVITGEEDTEVSVSNKPKLVIQASNRNETIATIKEVLEATIKDLIGVKPKVVLFYEGTSRPSLSLEK